MKTKDSEHYDLNKNTPIRDATLMMVQKMKEIVELLKCEQQAQGREDKSIILDANQIGTLSDLLESFGVSIADLDSATHKMLGFPNEYLIFSEESTTAKDSKPGRAPRKVLRKRRKQGRINKKKI